MPNTTRSYTLSVSHDNGATWTDVPVQPIKMADLESGDYLTTPSSTHRVEQVRHTSATTNKRRLGWAHLDITIMRSNDTDRIGRTTHYELSHDNVLVQAWRPLDKPTSNTNPEQENNS